MSNLLYIDDLKAYAERSAEIKQCWVLIEEFSSDISMEFSLDKYDIIHMKVVKIVHSPDVDWIPILSNKVYYKYFGIIEHDKILHDKTREIAKKESVKRVRDVLSTELKAIIQPIRLDLTPYLYCDTEFVSCHRPSPNYQQWIGNLENSWKKESSIILSPAHTIYIYPAKKDEGSLSALQTTTGKNVLDYHPTFKKATTYWLK